MQQTAQSNPAGANRQIARAAVVVMLTFVLSKLISLASTLILGRVFGASSELDAFYAANRFSDTLFSLVAGGALASAFIPTFTALLTRDDRPTAWRLASAITNLVLVVLAMLGALGAIFAPWVVANLLAPRFSPEQQALTAALLRIALHMIVQLPGLLRLPHRRYWPTLGLRSAEVRSVLLLMAPRLLGVAVVQLNFWINNVLASGQPEGSLTTLGLGFGLMMMPQAAIAQSIAIASLPTFSAQVARGRPDEMRASLAAILRAVLLLSIPATLGLMLLRRPVVAALYQHGAFTAQATEMVAWALLWYAAGLVGHCIVEVVSRAFYALNDTRTPVAVGIAAMGLNIAFSYAFSAWFTRMGLMPHGGLALANSLATALEAAVLLILMRRRLDGLHAGSVAAAAVVGIAAGSAMAALLWLLMRYGAGQPDWLLVVVGISAGGAAYLALLAALRVPELTRVLRAVLRRQPQ
jgi:putative peptidoglycan lipid II flippase